MDSGTIAMARQVATELCDIQPEPIPPQGVSPTSLVFPAYRPRNLNGQLRTRVSEAEARVLYCMALGNRRLPFAVEVPTIQQYAFSGTTKMSARTDLVVYASRPVPQPRLVRHLAIEFKAHNPRVESIRKDLEKLLREQCDGLWFHVLKSVHSRTIPVLMEKFTQAIQDLRPVWRECEHTLTVCIVVIEKSFWLYRTLAPPHCSVPDFSIDYEVRDKKATVRDAKAWLYEAF